MEKEDKICAICSFQKLVILNTVCGNKLQTSRKLKGHTKYNDTCDLFELRDESFYETGRPIESKNK